MDTKSSREQAKNYKDKIIDAIEALPNVTKSWTKFDDDIIRKYYPTKGTAIATILGRSKSTMVNRASMLGVHCRARGGD